MFTYDFQSKLKYLDWRQRKILFRSYDITAFWLDTLLLFSSAMYTLSYIGIYVNICLFAELEISKLRCLHRCQPCNIWLMIKNGSGRLNCFVIVFGCSACNIYQMHNSTFRATIYRECDIHFVCLFTMHYK